MTFKLPKKAKVSLHGVSRNALVLGRACTLREHQVIGVYDPDPQRALQAALFLGISARADEEQLLRMKPDVLLCSRPVEAARATGLWLNLFPGGGSRPNTCWVEIEGDSEEIPSEITSELPELTFRISGHPEAVEPAAAFLSNLSERFKSDL